jgi:hypothetical protein
MTSFDSDGFTNGADNGVNESGQTYVAWCWNAGGTAVSNTDGTITSSVSANTTAGFSIVSYTGTGSNATVGHGLSVTPEMIIVKERGNADSWGVFHTSLGNTKMIYLNELIGAGTHTTYWNDTSPTSSVFSVGSDNKANGSNAAGMIAYCWHSVEGYSKFGKYTGNGDADGPFIYTGFRPAFVLIKKSNSSGTSWVIFDNKRLGYNPSNWTLAPSNSNVEAEGGNGEIDLYSNGFKCRDNDSGVNADDDTYIYMAFAERPLKYARAR